MSGIIYEDFGQKSSSRRIFVIAEAQDGVSLSGALYWRHKNQENSKGFNHNEIQVDGSYISIPREGVEAVFYPDLSYWSQNLEIGPYDDSIEIVLSPISDDNILSMIVDEVDSTASDYYDPGIDVAVLDIFDESILSIYNSSILNPYGVEIDPESLGEQPHGSCIAKILEGSINQGVDQRTGAIRKLFAIDVSERHSSAVYLKLIEIRFRMI